MKCGGIQCGILVFPVSHPPARSASPRITLKMNIFLGVRWRYVLTPPLTTYSPEDLCKHDTANSPPEQGPASVYLDSGDIGANKLHPSGIESKTDDIPLLPGMPAGDGKSRFPLVELQNRHGYDFWLL